jgi:hypothetical protein
MATVTVRLAEFENGNVRVELDYDNVANLILAIRQINNTQLPVGQGDRAVQSKLTYLNPDGSPDNSKKYPVDGSWYRTPAGVTDATNVPHNVALQVPLNIVNLRGRNVISNLSIESQFPVA